MWEKGAFIGKAPDKTKTPFIFEGMVGELALPELEAFPFEQAFDELELLGFMLSSPFSLLKTSYRGNATAETLKEHNLLTVRIVGYYVCEKPTWTKNRKRMCFGTWLDDKGDFFDTVHFPPCLEKYPLQGKGCYLIQGKVTTDFEFPSLEVEKMAKLPFIKDPRY